MHAGQGYFSPDAEQCRAIKRTRLKAHLQLQLKSTRKTVTANTLRQQHKRLGKLRECCTDEPTVKGLLLHDDDVTSILLHVLLVIATLRSARALISLHVLLVIAGILLHVLLIVAPLRSVRALISLHVLLVIAS